MKSKAEKFWDRQAKSYDREEEKDRGKYEHIIKQIGGYLKPTDVVLDWGCGTGKFSNELAHKVQRIEAIDFSDKMVEVATAKAEKLNLTNINYLQATINNPKLQPQSYDVILCLYLFHLLDNPQQAIIKAKELLKPGGVIISVTPCMGESPALGFLFTILGRLNLLPKICLFRRPDVETLIKNAGFSIMETEPVAGTSNQYLIIAK